MYTVGQAAALTGVPQATLRAWERRYRVVQPTRSDGGYRLYDEAQIAVLRTMAQLVDRGVPASSAAVRAADGPDAPTGMHRVDGDLVDAARSLDHQRLRSLVERAFAAGPFEEILHAWLLPEVAKLGDAWESGELSIAQEHFASAQLMRAISSVFEAVEISGDAPPVLVGLPRGARHEIGVFSFATCLWRLGVNVIYLGSDVPVGEWVAAASARIARGLVVGVTMVADVDEAQAIVDACADLNPPLTVWAGGAQSEGVRRATILPDDMAEAARIVERSLAAGAA